MKIAMKRYYLSVLQAASILACREKWGLSRREFAAKMGIKIERLERWEEEHTEYETLGDIIKAARQRSGLTIEELANRLDISERYLYRIENEGKKPSFDILYNLIRELARTPDSIFYPERSTKDNEVEDLIRRLYNCDERSLKVVKATAIALIDTAPK